MEIALDEQYARRRAEVKATRWPVVVLAEVLKELRAPEPPEPVDARDISDEEREEETRRADAVDVEMDLKAEIEALEAAGGNVREYVEECRRQSFEEGLARFHPDHDRKGPRYADAAPLIADLRARGLGLKAIAITLNALGIPTARGGRWYATTIKNLIEKEMTRKD